MIELSRYVFETLREDRELALCRGRRDGELPTILLVAPVSEYSARGSFERLEHEYALRDELDSGWATRTLTLARCEDRILPVLEDPAASPSINSSGQG